MYIHKETFESKKFEGMSIQLKGRASVMDGSNVAPNTSRLGCYRPGNARDIFNSTQDLTADDYPPAIPGLLIVCRPEANHQLCRWLNRLAGLGASVKLHRNSFGARV